MYNMLCPIKLFEDVKYLLKTIKITTLVWLKIDIKRHFDWKKAIKC